MKLNIYNQKGILKATVAPADNSTHQHAIMEDNVINLSFVYGSYMVLDVNDYIEFEGNRYILLEVVRPQQTSSVEWTYNCKFYGAESVLQRALMLKTVDGELNPNFSLTAPAIEHLRLVVENINRILHTTDWKIGECLQTDNLVIDYQGTYCSEALRKIAEAAETEWWMDGMTINLTRCERNGEITLGYRKGLSKLDRGTADNISFFTRLFPLGSSRNIDRTEYGNTRLQLPGRKKYVEQNTESHGIIEHSEESSFAHIYPKRIGKVTSISSREATGQDGKPYTIYYFSDDTLNFDPNQYEIAGLVKQVSFESGELNGRDFEVNYDSEKRQFEIITQFPYEDGMQLPGGTLIPKENDEYILWNIKMPEQYYHDAEYELEEAVEDYMRKYDVDKSVYKGTTDYIDIRKRKIPLIIGQRVKLESAEYFPVPGYRHSRITRVTRKLHDPAQADIEISDVLGQGKLSQIQSNIDEVKHIVEQNKAGIPEIIKSWENTTPGDYNLFSALRSMKEFISKKTDDFVQGLITFFKGIKIGKYQEGLTGDGAYIDEHGVAEMTGLRLREFLEVPELRFNRIDVISGEQWNAPGFGTIQSVDTQNQVATLKLEEGELAGIKLNDFCRGIFHNLTGDADSSIVDECGFSTLPGFTTAYFTPVELLEGGKSFRYTLRPGTTAHPSPAMKFAVYGNATDKERQASAYSTRTYKRYLKDVDTWHINTDNIAMQFGDCSGLTIGKENLKSYSAYLNNIYITGTMKWLEEHKEEFKGDHGYSVSLSSSEAVLPLNNNGEVDASLFDIVNIIGGENRFRNEPGASTRKIQTRIEIFKGVVMLEQSETIDEKKYTVEIEAEGCKYINESGLLTVTEISQDDAVLNININCEGVAKFRKTFRILRVYSERGLAGADGAGFELIFKRTKELIAPEKPKSVDEYGYVPEGWTNDQQGTSAEWPYEYTCKRTRINGRWGSFSEPALWASFSNDGRDGYSVALSSYEGVVGVNADGEIDSSLYDIQNIVSGEEKAYSEADPLVTTRYKIQTRIFAFNGNRSLQYSDSQIPGSGKYSAILVPVGCTCRIDDGTVTILSITEDRASVEIMVNCEGNITIHQTYTLNRVYNGTDGVSPYSLNLTNDSASVPANEKGTVSNYSLASTTVQLFLGTNLVEGATFEVESVTPKNVEVTSRGDTFQVTKMPDNEDYAKVNIRAIVNGQPVGSIIFTVAKAKAGLDGKTPIIHYLSIPVSVIKRNAAGQADPGSFKVSAMMVVGDELPVVSTNSTIKYKRSDDSDWKTGDTITVTENTQYIDVQLIDSSSKVELDNERVPVVKDGRDGIDAYSLNLTNDSATVPADKNGVVANYDLASTSVQLFLGSTMVNTATFAAESLPSTVKFTQSGNVFKITEIPSTVNSAQLNISAQVNGKNVGTIIFTVAKAKAGSDGASPTIHYLSIPVGVVTRNKEGVATPSSITVSAMMVTGNSMPTNSNYTLIYYKRSDDSAWNYGSTIAITDNTTYVDIELRDSWYYYTVLDAERIPVVSDGKKGDDANLLPWVNEWDGERPILDDKSLISPRIFSGEKNPDGTLTGVAMGREINTGKGIKTGILGLKNGVPTFEIDAKGNAKFSGKVEIAGDKILLDTDGSGHLAGGNISWKSDGSASFTGKVDIAGEKILLDTDGSGKLASGNISWKPNGDLDIIGKFQTTVRGRKIIIDAEKNAIVFYDKRGVECLRIDDYPVDSEVYHNFPQIRFSYRSDSGALLRSTVIDSGKIYFSSNNYSVRIDPISGITFDNPEGRKIYPAK